MFSMWDNSFEFHSNFQQNNTRKFQGTNASNGKWETPIYTY